MKLKLLTNGKGIYPYSLCNDAHIMKKIVKFPPIEDFFNHLTNTACPTEDYNFAFKVYNTFNCKNLYEYTLLYNHTDTLLLAEIMMVDKTEESLIPKRHSRRGAKIGFGGI